MNKGCLVPMLKNIFCVICVSKTLKTCQVKKAPPFFCVPRVSKTLGLFDFYFLELLYVLKSNENKENRKNAFGSPFFCSKKY